MTDQIIPPADGYLRIAAEEAFSPPEMMDAYRKLLSEGVDDPGFNSLWGFYLQSPSERATAIIDRLQHMGEQRLAHMKATGIDRQIIALTSPGVQIFDKETAKSMAVLANDQLAEHCRNHPGKYTGMTAVAPQDPAHAAKEIERGSTKLGLKGVIVNSHTHDEYLDEEKFWPIFEAAEAMGEPIYIHPNTPSRGLIQPMLEAGLDGAVYGFGVETGLHTLRIIVKGVFDRFPNLKIVIGHMGEALPFWMYRLDYMQSAGQRSNRYDFLPKLSQPVSHYLKNNIYITTSGMAWEPAILFSQQVLGDDRVLYAMDYPYQYVADEVRVGDNLPVSPDVKKKFYQTNAETVFRL